MNNSLGKIGYEAARADAGGKTYDGRHWPTWEELAGLPHGERTRRTWEAGARAIGMAVYQRLMRALSADHCSSEACDGINDERTPREGSERPFCDCPCAGCGAARAEEQSR